MRVINRLARIAAIVFAIVPLLFVGSVAAQPADSVDPTTRQVYLPVISVPARLNSFEQAVVDLTNEVRRQHGCPELTISVQLSVAAHTHSQDMAEHNYFSHIDRAGNGPDWRARQAGYTGLSGWENIAAGYPSPEMVVDGWMNSPAHRENILNCTLHEIGVGHGYNENSTYNVYWTQLFGTP